ncbi:MAG: hypothetical protein ACFCVK_22405 [Acidimicrobiales bacterium]
MPAIQPLQSTTPAHELRPTDPVSGALSFGHCVDWLLDRYQATTDPELRAMVVEVLDELRDLGPVDDEMADVVVGALGSVAAAFELRASR